MLRILNCNVCPRALHQVCGEIRLNQEDSFILQVSGVFKSVRETLDLLILKFHKVKSNRRLIVMLGNMYFDSHKTGSLQCIFLKKKKRRRILFCDLKKKHLNRSIIIPTYYLSGTKKDRNNEHRDSGAKQFIKVIQMRRGKKFQCAKCSRTFVHLNKVEEHVRNEHMDDSDETTTDPIENDDVEVPEKKKATESETPEKDSANPAKTKRKLQGDVRPSGLVTKKRVKREGNDKIEKRARKENDDLACKVCSECFLEEYELLEHEVATHWTCASCQVQFMHEESWSKHQKLCKHWQGTRRRSKKLLHKSEIVSFPDLKPYQKEEKFLRFASVHFGDERTKKKMVCVVCNAKYETMTQLKKHIQGMHTREKEHLCDDCGKGFAEESKLIYHAANTCTKLICQGRDEKGIEGIAATVGEKLEEGTENLTLRLEDETSYTESSEQETRKDENTEVVFNITFDKDAGQSDSGRAEEAADDSVREIDTKMCMQCNMAFTYEFQRREHMSRCHWGCDTCGEQFLHEEPYQRHVKECKASQSIENGPFAEIRLRRIYEGEDDFFKYIVVKFKEVDKKKQVRMECLVCGKEYFGQLAKMMRHVKSVHTKECVYICDTCSKPFADKDNLGKHVNKCTGKTWVPKKKPQIGTDIIPIAVETAPANEDENITWGMYTVYGNIYRGLPVKGAHVIYPLGMWQLLVAVLG